MTSLSLAMLLLLCVSVHACTARSLSLTLTIKDTPHNKELARVKLLETSSVKNYKLEVNQPQQQKVANNELINTCESCLSVSSTLKERIVEAASVKIVPIDGGGYAETSFQMESPSSLATQDGRRHARSILRHAAKHKDEDDQTVVTNDTQEDIVEMDYAQPHRKPPIHNEKP